MVAQKSGEERWVDVRTSQDHLRYLEVTAAIQALKAEIWRLLSTISLLIPFYKTTHPHWGALLSCHGDARQVISSLKERPVSERGA